MAALHYSGSGSDSKTDSYGFIKPDDFDESGNEKLHAEYEKILTRRSQRWDTLGDLTGDEKLPASKKVKRFIRKGVPSSQRARIWMLSSGANANMVAHPGEYDLLTQMTARTEASAAIELDLDRTFPDNENFRNITANVTKAQLREILSCFAVKHPDIGYCQGLNYIGAMLLLVMKSPEKAVWIMDATIGHLPEYYHDDMKGLKIDMLVLRELIKRRDSEIEAVLHKFDVDLILLTSKWFLCWYLETLPMQTVLRIWDCLFYEGPKILFRVGMTLIIRNKQRLLKCGCFAQVADLFQQITIEPSTADCHKFINEIFTVPGSFSGAEIDKLRKQFASTYDERH